MSGQLGGVALIVFIVVILLLVICLGKFADEPLFQERDIFSMESSIRHMGSSRDNTEIEEDEDWKFDPLFAWSNQKSLDSKLGRRDWLSVNGSVQWCLEDEELAGN